MGRLEEERFESRPESSRNRTRTDMRREHERQLASSTAADRWSRCCGSLKNCQRSANCLIDPGRFLAPLFDTQDPSACASAINEFIQLQYEPEKSSRDVLPTRLDWIEGRLARMANGFRFSKTRVTSPRGRFKDTLPAGSQGASRRRDPLNSCARNLGQAALGDVLSRINYGEYENAGSSWLVAVHHAIRISSGLGDNGSRETRALRAPAWGSRSNGRQTS